MPYDSPYLANRSIAEHLDQIAKYYQQHNEEYRANAFRNAARIINELPYEVTLNTKLKGIAGLGKSSLEVITEFLQTGTSKRYQKLFIDTDPVVTERDLWLTEVTKIYGIGPVTANKLYDLGYRTIDQLYYSDQLTEAQKAGILYFYQIEAPIDRVEIDLFYHILRVYLPNVKYDIAGSYRRGKATSGDIDVLIEKRDGLTMNMIVEALRRFLLVDLAFGETKYMGIMRIASTLNAHRIDIRLIEPSHYPYALLYFTGSQQFNVNMRSYTQQLGLSLNEYTLSYQDGTPYPKQAHSEAEIFEFLGLPYVLPSDRI